MAVRTPLPIPGSPLCIAEGRVFVVAEIGKNFIQTEESRPVEEYLANALWLVDEAAAAGADAVKFQTHELDDEQLDIPVTSPHFTGSDRYRWVKRNAEATPPEFWRKVKARCAERKIVFFTTPMSRGAARKLASLDLPLWKVGSADLQDHVLVNSLLATGKPIVISTGMVSHAELAAEIRRIGARTRQLVVLYCVSRYPCPAEDFNLATIERLREENPDLHIGFSDHSIGPEAAFAAAGLGATVIEKHFSRSRTLWGSDHKVSMTPADLKELVTGLRGQRRVDPRPYYGSPEAELEGATNSFRPIFNKALVAGRDLPQGTVIAEEDVFAMRPLKDARGVPAHRLESVTGRRASRNLAKYDPLNPDTVEGLR
ncbi:MAG: N-acetylneuraminate synthase family protein [Planctomycetes bacterium]|nr:N-acetylneuraminate synthase family protein [Planctomycetota bacterium]